MILFDSSIWIEYFSNGQFSEQAQKYLDSKKKMLVPSVVIYETYKRLKIVLSEKHADQAASVLQKFEIVDLTMGVSLYAANLSLLHKLAMADAMVYATAQLYRAELITSDSDLKGLPGVVYLSNKK